MRIGRRRETRYAVVDVETTGFSNNDRIIEVAVVTMDASFRIIDEWETLVNPRRGVGPTHVHGITSGMVANAPTFEQASASLAQRLDGAVLVAHNLPFDRRMLVNEFSWIRASFDPGSGFCTYRATRKKLVDACDYYSIPLKKHHRALGDARAAAEILSRVSVGPGDGLVPARVRIR